jgi:hypothetical protein
MKKYFLLLSAIAALGITACNDNSNSTKTTTDSTVNNTTTANATDTGKMNAGTTTTTTTTTTTVTTRSLENRSLMAVGSNKPAKLTYDAQHRYYVEQGSNNQKGTYYYDPTTHDTFDYRGYNVNNALINKNGHYSTDESKVMNNTYNVQLSDSLKASGTTDNGTTGAGTNATGGTGNGNMKIKQEGNTYKEKTDSSKLKMDKNSMKVKTK